MPIIITPHAHERLVKYRLSALMVEECVSEPEIITAGNYGRKIAHRRLNGYVLRVIYEEKGNDIIVITAYKAKVGRYEI
ncbi:MAG TPA: DUF4258 domain-containing protein [archaeon]|nr:DUF4258 domain-containing protein [archaeon]